MRRLLDACVVMALACGCTTTRQAWTVTAVGGGIAVTGVVAGYAWEEADPASACCPPSFMLAVSSLVVGGTLALGALVNVAVLEAME